MWIGAGLRRLGLLTTPEESSVPAIIARANALSAKLAPSGADEEDALKAIAVDPALRRAHESFLPEVGRRRRGEIDVDEAVATAKLNDAQSLEDACAWLSARNGWRCSAIAH